LSFYYFNFIYKSNKISFRIKKNVLFDFFKKTELEDNKFEKSLILHHLGFYLYQEFKTFIKNIDFIDYEEIILNDTIAQEELFLFLEEFGISLNLEIVGNNSDVKDFLMRWNAKKLNLRNINNKIFLKEILFKINSLDCKLTIHNEKYLINSKDYSFIGFIIKTPESNEIIYVSKHLIIKALSDYHGYKFPVVTDDVIVMKSVICLINLWLSTMKLNEIKVINWINNTPQFNIYLNLIIESHDTLGNILVSCNDSFILKKLKKNEVINDTFDRNALNLDIKIKFPIIGNTFDISYTQINQLQVNSTIFNLMNINELNKISIDIGSTKILGRYKDDKIIILGKSTI
jgi:hypothetical protein